MSKARIRRRLLAARRYDRRQLTLVGSCLTPNSRCGCPGPLPWVSDALHRLATRVPWKRQWMP